MPSEATQVAYPVDAWVPLVLTLEQRQQKADAPRDLMVYGRLKPGVTLAQAKAELKTLAARSSANGSNSETEWSASVLSLRDYFVGANTRNALFMLMAVVVFVLLIACANVAGLLIARGAAREKELAVRQSIWSIDKEQPIDGVRSMTQVLREAQGGNALMQKLLGIFAVVTLLLAAIGIYGVIDYTVAERTREIGIRMALGARRGGVLLMIFRKTIVLAAFGLAIGLLLSLPLPRLLESSFQGLAVHPFAVFIEIPLLVVLVAAVSTYIPARRASKVDPLVTLRYE